MKNNPEKCSFHLYIRMDCSREDGATAELFFQRFHKELTVTFPDADIRTRHYDHVLRHDGSKAEGVHYYKLYGEEE